MPRGDRRGPEGLGVMTGRGMGFCTGYDTPGFANNAQNYGIGRRARNFQSFGKGIGRGFGWRSQSAYPVNPVTPEYSKEQEVEILKSQAEAMKASLDSINKRLEDLEK